MAPLLPLPKDVRDAVGGDAVLDRCSHFGLGFQMFIHHTREWGYSGDEKGAVWKSAVQLAERVFKGGCAGLETRLAERHERLARELKAHYGDPRCVAEPTGKVAWRLTLGLGNEHPLENGLTLHRVYGVPFLPGSAVKGVARAWALQQEAARLGLSFPEQASEAAKRAGDEFRQVFGSQDRAGAVCFLDAFPVALMVGNRSLLELDIVNPHYMEYYGGGSTPPADWLSPVPSHFLAVRKGTTFRFLLHGRQAHLVQRAAEWASAALSELGIGGKTSAGYGQLVAGG